MKCQWTKIVAVALLSLVAVTPAFATNNGNNNGGNATATASGGAGGAGGAGGQGGAGGSAAVIGSGNSYSTSGAVSGSVSGAAAGAEAKTGPVNQSLKIEAPKGLPMNTGVAVAPGLTSVGTFACLGSWSVGIAGPGAGISGGSTKVDKGCEHARDASILMGWAFQLHSIGAIDAANTFVNAAVKLLTMNADTYKAVYGEDEPKPVASGSAAIEAAMAASQKAAVEAPQAN